MSKSNTPIVEAEEAYRDFCYLLGKFFHAYTALEHELSCAVYAIILRDRGGSRDVLLAVLGGQRMAPLKDTLKRLLRATKASPKRKAFADTVFQHLGEIQLFRDRLAHNFTMMSDFPDVWINMNFAGIRERHQMEDLFFNLKALEAAGNDLIEIRKLLGPLVNHYSKLERTRLPKLPSWQYKSSMLVRHRPISSSTRKRQKRPQNSSRT